MLYLIYAKPIHAFTPEFGFSSHITRKTLTDQAEVAAAKVCISRSSS